MGIFRDHLAKILASESTLGVTVAVPPLAAPLVDAAAVATPAPPPPSRRRGRSEESEAASREDRLAVIAKTAQSKAMAVPAPPEDFARELEAELEAAETESHPLFTWKTDG